MAPFSTSESAILTASQHGDRNAYGQLVEQYKHLVCAVTYGATGDVNVSEDLAQETFVAAWTHLDRLRDHSAFRAWICGIARNIGLTWLRRRHKDVLARSEPIERGHGVRDPHISPRDAAIRREREEMVWQALEKIPEGFRIPIILYYREGRSVEEVARTLGMSGEAVRQRLHRGREFLQVHVAELVETSLSRSRPGDGFTAGVLAAIAFIPAGTMAKAGAATAGAAATMGWLGTLTSRGAFSMGVWGTAAGGAILLLAMLAGWNSGVKSDVRLPAAIPSETAAWPVAAPDESPRSTAAPAEVKVPESPAPVDVAAVLAADTHDPAQPDPIVVHPPGMPIREWPDRMPDTGPKGALAGQILTLDDMPAGGAEVEVFSALGSLPVSAAKVRANADGWFSVPLPASESRYWVYAKWRDMAGIDSHCSAPLMVESANTTYTQIRVEPALTVTGIVVDDASNRPLTGVVVVTSGGQTVRTDATGAFRFEGVHRTQANTLTVLDDKWVCARKEIGAGTGSSTVELRAHPAGAIHGRVLGPGGVPLKNVPVHLALSGSLFHTAKYLVETDESGSYRIAGVNPASARLPLLARKEGYRQADGVAYARFAPGSLDASVHIRVRPDATAHHGDVMPAFLYTPSPEDESELPVDETAETVAIPTTEGDWVAGRVIDGEGYPLACVTVLAESTRAMTNAEGEFRLDGLTASGNKVQVCAASRGDMGPGGTPALLQANRDNQIIVVRTPESEVSGTVLDKATGRPIQRFWVAVSRSPDGENAHYSAYENEVMVCSEDGTFTVSGLQARTGALARVAVRAAGYSNAVNSRVKVHSAYNSSPDGLTLSLGASPLPGGFSGLVVDKETGAPIPDALVSIHEASGLARGDFPYSIPFSGWESTVMNFPGTQHGQTDSLGVFSFPDWTDAEGWVAVECAGYGRYWLHDVPFSDAFKLEMEREAILTGRIHGAPDPHQGGIAAFWMQDGQAIWNTCENLSDDGSFYIDRLAPGTYMVQSFGLPAWRREMITLSAGETREIRWR